MRFPIYSLGCLAKKRSLLQTSAAQHCGLLCLGRTQPASVTETTARNDRDLNAGSGGQDAEKGLDLGKIQEGASAGLENKNGFTTGAHTWDQRRGQRLRVS